MISLSMLLFMRMGVPASREAHTRLYVNNEYVGLYTIVESIDKVFLKEHFGEDGGYLYKYNYDSGDPPHYLEYLGSDPALYSPKPFQPETHEQDPDPKPIVDMIRAINETPDSDFLSVMASYLDLTQFITQMAVENFVADIDGFLGDFGANNVYLYLFEKKPFSTFLPWDKSEAFKGGIEFGIWHNISDVMPSIRNRLMDRAMQFIDLRDVYLDALLKCATIATSPDPALPSQPGSAANQPGWLEQEITYEYGQIRSAALEDRFKPYSNEEFEESIQQLLTFARERSAFVQRDVARSRR